MYVCVSVYVLTFYSIIFSSTGSTWVQFSIQQVLLGPIFSNAEKAVFSLQAGLEALWRWRILELWARRPWLQPVQHSFM